MLQDGWHHVAENSFKIDSFEFMHGDDLQLRRGTVESISSTGARWKDPEGFWIACQITDILAVSIADVRNAYRPRYG